MNILCIDIGSYSIKFFETSLERKQLKLVHKQEIIIEQVKDQFDPNAPVPELQRQIIASFLNHEQYDGKVIYQLPSEMVTSRYLNLPVNNRKKAEQMVPFQLDENLPYSSSEAHFTSELYKQNGRFSALINIAKIEPFEEYYLALEQKNILPNLLTTDISLIHNFINTAKITEAACIIDIGHYTTKSYFIKDGQLISNHISHFGGEEITNVIAKSYDISTEEAQIYKHENCFFLTKDQFEDVDQDQKDFATLMENVIQPLLADFKRWELGFRGRHAIPLRKIYLTGGTTKIQNIDNFFSDKLKTRVERLNVFDNLKQIKITLSRKEQDTYFLNQLMAISQLSKAPPSNLLVGNYSRNASMNLPLHSTTFLVTRIVAVTILLISLLFIERIVVSARGKDIQKQVSKLIKNPRFQISKKDQIKYRKHPDRLLKIISKQNESLQNQLDTIKKSSLKNPIKSLADLSRVLSSNLNVDLVSFETSKNLSIGKFSSKNSDEIKAMIKHIRTSSLKDAQIEYKKGATTFTLKYKTR